MIDFYGLSRCNALIATILAQFPARVDQVNCSPPPGTTTATWFSPPSTAETNAFNALVAGWDFSKAAYDADVTAKTADRTALRNAATNAMNANATYIALANPTTAQQTAQIKTLTQQMQQVIKRLIQLD